MKLNYLDKQEYEKIPLLKMVDNKHGNLPFFARKYITSSLANGLHRHEYLQINYISQGKGMHFVNGYPFEIIKGDIFVIPPYIPHYIAAQQDSSIEVIEFEFIPEFVSRSLENDESNDIFVDFAYIEPFLVSENKVKPRLNLVGKTQQEVERILSEVLLEYNEKPQGYNLLIKAMLLKLLVLVGREFKRSLEENESGIFYNRHRDAIYGALQYISEHYSEELVLEDIAKMFALSQSYFSYLFKNITSKTFIEYLTGLRISKAMELLKTTDKRVLDICYETGFNSVNHFNRIFKQIIGISPTQYRKKSEQNSML